jgi:hypothetical protein
MLHWLCAGKRETAYSNVEDDEGVLVSVAVMIHFVYKPVNLSQAQCGDCSAS